MRAILLAACAALAACGQTQQTAQVQSEMAAAPMEGDAAVMGGAPAMRAAPADAPQQAAPAGPGAPPPQAQNPTAYLAYAYQITAEAPAPAIAGLVERQAAGCRAAGPRVCQLIAANVSGDPESEVTGQLNLRGEPTWLRGFMSGAVSAVSNAGGRIQGQSTTAEDLTRQIIDTEASLRAKRTLRDRLQQLLASRPGRLADLLEVERELARVQAEIDSTESMLAAMRTRVDMSELSLSYVSQPRSIGSTTFDPLGQAFAGFLGNAAGALAVIVTLVALMLPWAIIIALAMWVALAVRRGRGGRFIRRREPIETDASSSS